MLELLAVLIWSPIGFIMGLVIDLWQIWTIRVQKPEFAWVIFKADEDRLLKTLQSYFPAGKSTPKEILLFSQQQKVASNTYIADNHITLRATAWFPTPWRWLCLANAKWIITFEFSDKLVHISDIPSENYLVASAMLVTEELPDIFQRATLTNIKLNYAYTGL